MLSWPDIWVLYQQNTTVMTLNAEMQSALTGPSLSSSSKEVKKKTTDDDNDYDNDCDVGRLLFVFEP